MKIVTEFISGLKKYAVFTGRATRPQFWWFQAALVVVNLGLLLIGSVAGVVDWGLSELLMRNVFIVTLLFGLFIGIPITLGLLVPTLAITARRYRDVGISPWFLFILLFPFLGALASLIITLLPSKPEGVDLDR